MNIEACLEQFEQLRRPGPFEYRWHHHYDGGNHGLHLVIGAIVHGDEVGSVPAVLKTIAALQDGAVQYGGRVTFFLGNPEASLQNVRFLESDLNRVFVDDPLPTHEGRRAGEIRPMLDSADVFLDIHQTILFSDRPFYIFPFGLEGWRWARAVAGASTWVTRAPTARFSSGTCCADEYVRLRGRPGLTLELGPRGFSADAEARATAAIHRLFAVADRVASGEALDDIACNEADLNFVETVWRCRFEDPRMRLREGLTNFAEVRAGERLSAPGTPSITSPCSGMLLFPKYGAYADDGAAVEPRPGEIVRVVRPLAEHPASRWLGKDPKEIR